MAAQTTNYNFDKPQPGGDSNVWGTLLNGNWDSVDTELARIDAVLLTIFGDVYPVGSLYSSTNATLPATLLALGQWELLPEGHVLAQVASGASLEDTVGSDTINLTSGQLPSHNHSVDPPTTSLTINSGGAHTHSYQRTENWTDWGDTGFVGGNNDARYNTQTTGSSGSHSHTGTVNIAQFNSGSTGSGDAVSVQQRTVYCNIWKRVS